MSSLFKFLFITTMVSGVIKGMESPLIEALALEPACSLSPYASKDKNTSLNELNSRKEFDLCLIKNYKEIHHCALRAYEEKNKKLEEMLNNTNERCLELAQQKGNLYAQLEAIKNQNQKNEEKLLEISQKPLWERLFSPAVVMGSTLLGRALIMSYIIPWCKK